MLLKEDKKIKNWGTHPHFYNKKVQKSTKLDFQLKLLVYQKQLELSFLQNVAKTTERSFFLLYSICHQVQGHFHLD